MNNLERAAQVLLKHWSVAQETGQDDECDCCAQALADAGLLMPGLPDENNGEWSAGFSWGDGDKRSWPAHAYAWAPGEIGISSPKIMTTDQAEVLAHAILAAVKSDRKHTKRNQSNDNE